MQVGSFGSVRFGGPDKPKVEQKPADAPEAGKQRYIIMLKDEALEKIANKAVDELVVKMNKAGVPRQLKVVQRNFVKVLVNSKTDARFVKTALAKLPGVEKTAFGDQLNYRTELPESFDNLVKVGFPKEFPVVLVFANRKNPEQVYRF